MNITFLLPDYTLSPVGGFKIVYSYAQELIKRHHSVTIAYGNFINQPLHLWLARTKILRHVKVSWFPFTQEIKFVFMPTPKFQLLPDSDVLIATGVQTAHFVSMCPESKGRKFYLVQHLEDWITSVDEVYETWRLPITKLAISQWLVDLISVIDPKRNVEYVPNPFDLDTFFVESFEGSHDPRIVSMMWSTESFKRALDGLAAIEVAHEQIPDLHAILFGTAKKPRELPSYVEYRRRPFGAELRHIYNESSIFVHSSASEGYGLPPGEAMACGVAVVSTDNAGVCEYLNSHNSILCEVGDIEALGNGIVRMSVDHEMRMGFIKSGLMTVRERGVRECTDTIEHHLLRSI